MDMNNTPEPRMPRVENLEFLDLMGVILSLCTMRSVSTKASVIARRGKFTRKACGYMDDRRCRPATLPPLPEPARKAGKCSPSPTYPQAPPPTTDLILIKQTADPSNQPSRPCDWSRHRNRQGNTLTIGSGCLTIGVHLRLRLRVRGRWQQGEVLGVVRTGQELAGHLQHD